MTEQVETAKPENGHKPEEQQKLKIEWKDVKAEDIPPQLLDRHPTVKGLKTTVQQLQNDIAQLSNALFRNHLAVQAALESQQDRTNAAFEKMSPIAKQIQAQLQGQPVNPGKA